MLKNCFLPVNYNKSNSQICGEIVCENLKEFIINCKLCKIKIFAFEEFVLHLKNIHLCENSVNNAGSIFLKGDDSAKNYNKVKFEVAEVAQHDNSPTVKSEKYDSIMENVGCTLNMENSGYSDDDEGSSNEIEHSKSILRKTRKPKDLSCEICSKKYADSRRLLLHVKIVHLRRKPFKCFVCDQTFAQERCLSNHIDRKHTNYECSICHKRLATSRNLEYHMLMHLDKKEFVCNDDSCGKAFATKDLLNVHHQRYHNGVMFVCEECGYKCRKRDSLLVHKRHHTGEKPFGCSLCDRRFASKRVLSEHIAGHETERKYVCDVCGKSFNRSKALYHHKHLHLGVKKFACKICSQAYAQASGLSNHMRKHRECKIKYSPLL